MTTQVIKAIKVLSIMATVRSQILFQLTAKMIYGLKSLHMQSQNCQNATSLKCWHKAGL